MEFYTENGGLFLHLNEKEYVDFILTYEEYLNNKGSFEIVDCGNEDYPSYRYNPIYGGKTSTTPLIEVKRSGNEYYIQFFTHPDFVLVKKRN